MLPNRQVLVVRTVYERARDLTRPFPPIAPDGSAPRFDRRKYSLSDQGGRAIVHLFELYYVQTTEMVVRWGKRALDTPPVSSHPCRIQAQASNRFQIADYSFTPRNADAPPATGRQKTLPTISVFVHSTRLKKLPDRPIDVGVDPSERVEHLPCELLVFDFYATTRPDGIPIYAAHYHSSHGHLFPEWPVVLPGFNRYLAFTVPRKDLRSNPAFLDLWRRFRFEPKSAEKGYLMKDDPVEEAALTKGRRKLPAVEHIWSKFTIPDRFKDILTEDGVASLTYDESIGRVCIVPGGKSQRSIMYLEAAQAKYPDERIEAWGGCQEC